MLPASDALLSKIRSWIPAGRGGEQVCSVYLSRGAVATGVVATGAVATDVAGQTDAVNVDLRADPLRDLNDLEDVLRTQLSALNARNRPCHLVLAPELYVLQLVERPDVPADEVQEAVRWKLQEQVDFAVENAALDVFAMPAGAERHQNMVFAVIMPRDLLSRIVASVTAAGIGTLASIDVSELALRNFAWRCFPQADQSVGLLRLTANSGLINVSRAEDLYLSRRISGVPEVFSEANWQEFHERLLVQVQRSLDYYQSAMSQPACDMLMVACSHDWTEKVTEYLAEMLPMPVRAVSEAMASEYQLRVHNPQRTEVRWAELSETQANVIAVGIPALGGVLRKHIQQSMAA